LSPCRAPAVGPSSSRSRWSGFRPLRAETLGLHERIGEVRALGYDRPFERTWNFYLAFCEAAFRTRALRDVHLTLTRPFNEALA
jgi:cyclopropane-fatty-acyl-phospholipid synthase